MNVVKYFIILSLFLSLSTKQLFSEDLCKGVGVDELLSILNSFKTCGDFKKYINIHPCIDIRGVIEGIELITICNNSESSFSTYKADKDKCILIVDTEEFGGMIVRVDAYNRTFDPALVGTLLKVLVGEEKFVQGSELMYTHGVNLCNRSKH